MATKKTPRKRMSLIKLQKKKKVIRKAGFLRRM